MATHPNFNAEEFCMRLLKSELEEEVVDILKEYGYWDDRAVWKPYGDIQNNRSIVSNQRSSAVAALVEKLVNSIDAVLTAECYHRGVDPKSKNAPQSMREAAQQYFDIKDGRIQSLDSSERTHLEPIRKMPLRTKAEILNYFPC
jgi:ribosomal protein S8